MPTQTPWGPAQTVKKYCTGINLYSTAGHGGFKVSTKKNLQVHPALRIQDGWYEEDCDFGRVVLAFPELFSQEWIQQAHSMMKNYNPDQYQEWYRQTRNCPDYEVEMSESHVLRRRQFQHENRNFYIVVSASGCGGGMLECYSVRGGRNQDGNYAGLDRKTFLVRDGEYNARGEFGFVIDPFRHMEKKEESR